MKSDKKSSLRVRSSKIKGAGKGLFVTKKYVYGSLIQIMGYRAATKAEIKAEHRFIAWIDGEPLYVLSAGRYANHSSYPNAELVCYMDGTMMLKALHDIEPGEEVTINYGEDWE